MQKKRVLIACLVFLTAFFSRVTAQDQGVFKTPEAAITFYLEGVAQGDFHKILQACAIQEMSEKFKFDLYIERLQVFLPFQSLAPTNAPFYVELNKAQLSAQIANQVKILVFSLLSSENVGEGRPIKMDTQSTATFMQAVNTKRLAQLAVKKIDLPNKTLMNNAKYLENAAKIARIYGADESTERAVLFAFEQNDYYLGFTLLRYGESWKISAQYSPMTKSSALGAAVKTTPEEFEHMINGN